MGRRVSASAIRSAFPGAAEASATIVVEGQITEIHGYSAIPFIGDQIATVLLTHDKWNFNAER